MTIGERLTSWLESRRAPWAIVALGVLAALPSIRLGFYNDDYVFRATLDGAVPGGPPFWDLYRFIPGTPVENFQLVQTGFIPWWSAIGLKVHLVRPLASVLFALDHRLFGASPLGYHVHSLLWYAALVAVVGMIFRRILPRATAHVAMLIFALAPAHFFPFGWPSCRHMVIAATFGLLGLAMYLRDPTLDRRRGRSWLALGLAAGLLGGETALGVLAYPCARSFFDDRAPLGRRIRPLLPSFVVLAGYLAVYRVLRGGAAQSAGYVDPMSAPGRFFGKAATLLPIAAGNAVLGLPLELATVGPIPVLVVIGLVATALAVALARACAPSMAPAERSALPWLVTGAVVAIVPTLGGFPGARLLLVSNVGIAALLAILIRRGLAPGGGLRRVAAGALAAIHLVLAAPISLANANFNAAVSRSLESIVQHAEIERPGAAAEGPGSRPGPRVFVLGASDPIITLYVPAVVAANSPHRMSCWSVISATKGRHRVRLIDDRTLYLQMLDGPLLQGPFETLYRSPDLPLYVGAEAKQCGATFRVTEVDAVGRPTQFMVRFDTSLTATSIRLLAWKDGGLQELALPRMGESVDVPWSPGPLGMF